MKFAPKELGEKGQIEILLVIFIALFLICICVIVTSAACYFTGNKFC